MPTVMEGPDRMELDAADDDDDEDEGNDDDLMDPYYDDSSSEDDDDSDPDYEEGTDVFGLAPRDRYPSTRIPFSLLPKEDPPAIPQTKTEELWPSQFDSKYLKKAGFIYKTPVNIADSHTKSKRSITSACIEFGMRGHELWSREPLRMYRRWSLNEIAGQFRTDLRPIGYGKDLVGSLKAKLTALKKQKHLNKRRDVNRSRKIVERYKDGEKGIHEHDIRMSLRVMQRHVKDRRSFGAEGPLAQAGKGRTCVRRGCNLEFGHKGPHSIL